VRSLEAHVRRHDGAIALRYVLEADPEKVRVPEVTTPTRTDGLWCHTCFEIFIRKPQDESYCELNFSPSGQWAVYRFSGYRAGMTSIEFPAPAIETQRKVRGLEVRVDFDLAPLDRAFNSAPLQIALSAVIEDDRGALTYWALKHPAGKPDFHDSDGFALTLPATRSP
jgi:hypothetical protein